MEKMARVLDVSTSHIIRTLPLLYFVSNAVTRVRAWGVRLTDASDTGRCGGAASSCSSEWRGADPAEGVAVVDALRLHDGVQQRVRARLLE